LSKFNFLKKLGILGSITCLLSGCSFNPSANVEPDVYGPPPMEEYADDDDISDNDNIDTGDEDNNTQTPEKIDDYNVEQNEPLCIYGPPEMFEEEYDPKENIEDDVYGPPVEDMIDE